MSTAPKIAKLDMASALTECPEFSALQSHYEAASKLHMRALFEADPGRFEKFRYSFTDLVFYDSFVLLRLACSTVVFSLTLWNFS